MPKTIHNNTITERGVLVANKGTVACCIVVKAGVVSCTLAFAICSC